MRNAKGCVVASAVLIALAAAASTDAASGFVPLFNGRDFSGWKIPAGDNGHWRVVDGVIDYDAESQAAGEKSLWTEASFGDFVLKVDWRLKATPYLNPSVPIIRFDGTPQEECRGKGDSHRRARRRLWNLSAGFEQVAGQHLVWPIGSGEVYGYRTDRADAGRGARRRDAEAQRRSRHRSVELVRDYDARHAPHRRPERRRGDRRRSCQACRRAARSRCSITAR